MGLRMILCSLSRTGFYTYTVSLAAGHECIIYDIIDKEVYMM